MVKMRTWSHFVENMACQLGRIPKVMSSEASIRMLYLFDAASSWDHTINAQTVAGILQGSIYNEKVRRKFLISSIISH